MVQLQWMCDVKFRKEKEFVKVKILKIKFFSNPMFEIKSDF